MNYWLTIALALLSTLSLYGQSGSTRYAEAYITSSHLMPGQQAILWVRVQGGQPDGRPQVPDVEGAAINYIRAVTQLNTERKLTQVYAYRVSAPNPGKYIIPPITVSSEGKRLLTDPLIFRVHPTSVLTSLPSGIRGSDIKIGWFPAKTTLYQNEVCPIVLKIYAPTRLRVVNYGLPDPEKQNCLAWRFSLPNPRQANTAILDGKTYQVVRYTTTLSGIAPGKATLGPTKLRLITQESVIDPRVGSKLIEKPLPLTLPELVFDILPLPSGAPEHFDGAVGKFQVLALSKKINLKETDSAEVVLHIDGTGNLPTLKAPSLADDTWKIIDTSKVTRGEERRYTTGRVTFRQLLRPTSAAVTTIPSYKFSYFDPDDQSYRSLRTAPIPVTVTSVATSPKNSNSTSTAPDKNTAPDKMQDIIGFISKPTLDHSASANPNRWQWNLVPIALALLIIGIAINLRHKKNLLLNPDAGEKKLALNRLSEAADTLTFYRRAGRIIDRWHQGGANQQELQEILAERDALCFQPEGSPTEDIPAERKKSIISILRRSTKLIAFIFFITIGGDPATAEEPHSSLTTDNSTLTARDAWKAGNYQQALSIYQQQYPDSNTTPADVLYNIGNCHFRLDQPGLAALAWRRTLQIDSTHQQARQNLRFIEIAQNANVPETFPWQPRIALVSSGTYYFILYACAWTIMLATLAMLLFLKKKIVLVTTILTVCLAGVVTTIAGFALAYYPDGHMAGPPEKQAVILATTPLYTEAHRLSNESEPDTEHLSLKPASLVLINAQRGPWLHVKTFDEQEGWVEAKNLGKVVRGNRE